MHEPGPQRDAGQFRRVAQEREPWPIGEYPVGGELITCHGARPGKVAVRRGPQRLLGGCQVPGLKAVAACSFWLVEALALNGRQAEARELFERLLALRNDLGLYAEEYVVARRRQVGNFPQAFARLALISAA